ncbi:hypothetical protein GCM10023354_13190 [Garicola koreensis]|uniref:protein kinase domain-containing protein n=1 Tax=Garicola koreensis TaxID=1262554 RepID=UPI0031F0BB1C
MNETSPQVLNGRYQIDDLIGRGGMADVYSAHDLSLDRTVAVKMLRPDLARDPVFHTRFRREAQSSASLNHPNIVGVYDTGEAEIPENGHDAKAPYIVMEHVDGVTLRHILHGTPSDGGSAAAAHSDPPPPPDAQTEETQPQSASGDAEDSRGDVLGVSDDDATQAVPRVSEPLQEKIDHALGSPLSEQEAAEYMAGVLGALNYSHGRGIVHRDIKPSNVMVGNSGEVKVMDFGIARALADSAQTMTQTSAVVGTAQYLSPEQARGEVVDHRSDLYSAGCVLFELLTNRPPFMGESPVSVAYQHVREDAPRVSDFNNRVSPAMESVVSKALIKDPALRFQSADEFNHAVQDALSGIAVDETPTAELASVGAAPSSFDEVVAPTSVGTPLSARTPQDPDIDDYYPNYREPPRRRSRGVWAVLLLLLTVGIIAGGTFLLSRVLGSENMVSVPAVENMSRSEAITELTDAGLEADPQLQNHAEIEPDHVIGTDPEANSEVEDGSTVILYVSDGADLVRIPDGLVGETEESVRQTLQDAGLRVGEVTEESHASLAEGEVSATDPQAGTEVEADSEVNLTLAGGTVEIPVGVVPGAWRTDVQNALGAAGIAHELQWVETQDVEFDGAVLEVTFNGQPVSSGDEIPNDAAVLIRAGYTSEPQDDETDQDDEDQDSSDDEASPDDEGGDGDEDSSDDEASPDDEGGDGDEDSSDDEASPDDEGGDGEGSSDEETGSQDSNSDGDEDQGDSSNGSGSGDSGDGSGDGGNENGSGNGDGNNGDGNDGDGSGNGDGGNGNGNGNNEG